MRSLFLTIGVFVLVLPVAQAQDVNLSELSLEVNALRTLHDLDLTTDQLQALAKLADGAAQKPRERSAAKAYPKLRKALDDYRAALVKGDDDRIGEARDQADDLRDKIAAELDDEIEVTETARQRAPKALRLINARQASSLLAAIDVHDPLELLTATLDEIRPLKGKAKDELREHTAK
jgi:hypothetical protein